MVVRDAFKLPPPNPFSRAPQMEATVNEKAKGAPSREEKAAEAAARQLLPAVVRSVAKFRDEFVQRTGAQ